MYCGIKEEEHQNTKKIIEKERKNPNDTERENSSSETDQKDTGEDNSNLHSRPNTAHSVPYGVNTKIPKQVPPRIFSIKASKHKKIKHIKKRLF